MTRPDLLAGEDAPAPPRQKRSREKRERLMEAGLACFAKSGYEGSSLEDVARSAGVPIGTFYQHFRSKRQFLLALMDDLLERLSGLDLRPGAFAEPRAALRRLLGRAFAHDLHYLGAYRAWQEAVLTDDELAAKNRAIHAWTAARVIGVFRFLQQQPGARQGVDIQGLALAMDSFFWSLLAQAVRMNAAELDRSIDAATHLIHHALFEDPARKK